MTTAILRRPHQTLFTLQTDWENLVPSLRLQYGTYLSEAAAPAGEVITATRHGAVCRVRFQGETLETAHPLEAVDSLLFEHTRYDPGVFAMHGAAVEHGGRAYLFLAATTSGKTTLAGYLTSRGCGYVTDDCILLRREDFMVIPYAAPLHLREGGMEVLRRYHAAPPSALLLDDPVMRRMIYTPDNCVSTPLPLAGMFFISRTAAENALLPMSANERMAALMKAPITDYPVNGEYLRFLSSLARQADCRRLLYSDLAYVEEVVCGG